MSDLAVENKVGFRYIVQYTRENNLLTKGLRQCAKLKDLDEGLLLLRL